MSARLLLDPIEAALCSELLGLDRQSAGNSYGVRLEGLERRGDRLWSIELRVEPDFPGEGWIDTVDQFPAGSVDVVSHFGVDFADDSQVLA